MARFLTQIQKLSITAGALGKKSELTLIREQLAVSKFVSGMKVRTGIAGQSVVIVINDAHRDGVRAENADFEFWQRTQTVFEQAGFGVLRSSNVFSPHVCPLKGCFLFRDGHWSEEGHAAVAASLADYLRPRQDR